MSEEEKQELEVTELLSEESLVLQAVALKAQRKLEKRNALVERPKIFTQHSMILAGFKRCPQSGAFISAAPSNSHIIKEMKATRAENKEMKAELTKMQADFQEQITMLQSLIAQAMPSTSIEDKAEDKPEKKTKKGSN